MSKIKGILFDMDGVLVDAKDWHYEALNRALALFGMEISRYDHLVTYDGLPTRKKLEMLTKERGLPYQLHKFINELKQIYTYEIVHQRCKPIFIHQFALSRLKSDGYKIAVCSNSIRKTIDLMMDRAELLKYIDLIVSNEDVAKPKPDPEIYHRACLALDIRPNEALILEDNQHGIEAALGSGGNLLRVESVQDVTYERIQDSIRSIETGVLK